MNLQFGPFLVIMHRLLDNAITRKRNWDNIDKSLPSLLWSVVLGIILGFYNRRK
ncbi:MAG: hypothetical protein L6422_09545 [Candidatus Marinimicrobia bacterium]|nr:hypothetical protein [bacterium]MCG2716499.1 hypothetical protein [Candidatus Neomarinimicrobiota bacterium]